MKIYVTRPIPEAGLNILRQAVPDFEMNTEDRVLTRPELLTRVKGLEGLLALLTDRIDGELLDAAGAQLKIVANHAVGFDNVDLRAATERGVLITNTPGVLTDATADHAWALLFAVARRIAESEKFLRAGKFKGWGPLMFLGGDITGKTLGIVGAGRIGHHMALRSRGFNMQVLYSDEVANSALEKAIGARRVPTDELLHEADFVSLHVPLTPDTRHLINAGTLKKMKRTAYVINTSRGPVVDEAALAEALRHGIIAGAALDVFENEPAVHPGLLELDNVLLTPHIASATIATRSNMATMDANNLLAGLRGEKPPNLVNEEVWGKHRR
jgi:lactate dehydrogenase-like 2-hydroxyacid dehydrogenase